MKKILLSFLCCMLAIIGMQAEEVTLSFDNKAQRTTFTTSQQVWEQNGITFTNDKASSSNDVADYANPVRLYAGSKVTVAYPQPMSKIVFVCSGSTYASDLKNSIGSDATVSGSNVTVTVNNVTEYVIAKLTKQVRLKSITVTYTASASSIDVPQFNPASTQFEGEQTVEILHEDKECEIHYSKDGEEGSYERYIGAIKVNKTTTIWAYAKKGNSESIKVFATYTAFVEAPTLSTPDDVRTFEESLTVTINVNEEKGLKAFYSTDGKNYSEGNQVTITETTTVYAKAQDANGNESAVVKANYTKIEPLEDGEYNYTISFATADQRVSQDDNSQIWREGCVTLVNNKTGNSSSVVADVNPAKFYKNSIIVVATEQGAITEIVFDCNSNEYATSLANSIGATANSDKVTVALDGTTNSITINLTKGQVRMDAVTVTFVVDNNQGGDTPDNPEVTLAAPTLPADCNFDGEMEVTITYNDETEGVYVEYSTNGVDYTKYTVPFKIFETTTVHARATDGTNTSDVVSATYTKNEVVTPDTPEPVVKEVTDELDRPFTGVSGTNYASWSGKECESGAVYAGNSAGGNDAIQLRSNNSNSGIVTTKSGGIVKKITVEWHSATAQGRVLQVYGSNVAYTSPTELYKNDTDGELLGTIECGASTECFIEGEYEYIGLRSNSGAMYLTSINIVWEQESAQEAYPENIVAGDYYLELGAWVDGTNAWYAMYLCNKNNNPETGEWVVGYHTVVNDVETVIYDYTGVNAYTHMIFCRMSYDNNYETAIYDTNWENVIDRTDVLTYKPATSEDCIAKYIILCKGEAGLYAGGEWGEYSSDDIATALDRVEATAAIRYANGVVVAEGAIEVYNVNGMVVARGNETIDLRNLAAGVYIVRNGNNVRKVVR